MCSLESFKIHLKDLTEDVTSLEYDLDDDFFGALDASDVNGGSLHVSVSIRKMSGFFELQFHSEGMVVIMCDLCLDDMQQPIVADNRLVVRLGSAYSEDDDVVTIDEDEGILDVAWLIYEFIVLAIPVRHVHAPGKCNPAMIQVLEEHSTDRSSDEESTETIDPRWEKLKGLKLQN